MNETEGPLPEDRFTNYPEDAAAYEEERARREGKRLRGWGRYDGMSPSEFQEGEERPEGVGWFEVYEPASPDPPPAQPADEQFRVRELDDDRFRFIVEDSTDEYNFVRFADEQVAAGVAGMLNDLASERDHLREQLRVARTGLEVLGNLDPQQVERSDYVRQVADYARSTLAALDTPAPKEPSEPEGARLPDSEGYRG